MPADQKTIADEIIHRLAHCDATDAGAFGNITLRRQGVAMLQAAAIDGVFNRLAQFQVKRAAA
ncbi:hypothetical protein D3C73_1640220 [compost metagenome]